MGRAPHQGRWLRASQTDEAIVDDALSRCGAADFGDRPFDQLSGGERKRVMVAQALSQQPSFLLLDEPAAFLDLKHGIDVFELLLSEVARGIGVLAILHDLALAARYAERVALLVDGALQAPGSVDEVLMPANLQAAFGVELQRFTDESGRPRAFAPRTNRRA